MYELKFSFPKRNILACSSYFFSLKKILNTNKNSKCSHSNRTEVTQVFFLCRDSYCAFIAYLEPAMPTQGYLVPWGIEME